MLSANGCFTDIAFITASICLFDTLSDGAEKSKENVFKILMRNL